MPQANDHNLNFQIIPKALEPSSDVCNTYPAIKADVQQRYLNHPAVPQVAFDACFEASTQTARSRETTWAGPGLLLSGLGPGNSGQPHASVLPQDQLSILANAEHGVQEFNSGQTQPTTSLTDGTNEHDYHSNLSDDLSLMQAITVSNTSHPRHQHGERDDLYCRYPDCKRKKPFTKKSDLKRHITAKHKRTKQYFCPVLGCFKGQSRTAFATGDGLLNHVRSVHSETALAECPCEGCTSSTLQLDLLAMHIIKVHGTNHDWYLSLRSVLSKLENGIARAVVNAMTGDFHPCPLCRKLFHIGELMSHVRSHDQKELTERQQELAARNLYLINDRDLHVSSTALAQQTAQPNYRSTVVDIKIRCPACGAANKDHGAFADHMVASHLISERETAHFENWKRHATESKFRTYDSDMYPISCWLSRSGRSQVVQCPSCTWSKMVGPYGYVDHHFSMFSGDELKPYRQEILRLYPAFALDECWSVVWDDLVKPVNSIEDADHDDAMQE